MALLNLGTYHNRFYVERKAVRLIGFSMDDNLARAIKVDFMTDKTEFCRIIKKLNFSINYDVTNMHPLLNKAYNDNCK